MTGRRSSRCGLFIAFPSPHRGIFLFYSQYPYKIQGPGRPANGDAPPCSCAQQAHGRSILRRPFFSYLVPSPRRSRGWRTTTPGLHIPPLAIAVAERLVLSIVSPKLVVSIAVSSTTNVVVAIRSRPRIAAGRNTARESVVRRMVAAATPPSVGGRRLAVATIFVVVEGIISRIRFPV